MRTSRMLWAAACLGWLPGTVFAQEPGSNKPGPRGLIREIGTAQGTTTDDALADGLHSCHVRREGFFHECLEHGGDEEECGELARSFLERCIREKCGESADGVSRGKHQGQEAAAVFTDCPADDGGLHQCADAAGAFFRDCLLGCEL